MPTDLPQTPRRVYYKTSPGVQVGLAVLAFAVLLDGFDYWGRFFAPDLLAHTACSLLPLTTPIWPITFDSVIRSAHAECSTVVTQRTISIILFMLKMSIAIVALIPYWIWAAASPEEFRIARARLFEKFNKPNGVRDQVRFSIGAVIMLTFLCVSVFRTIISPDFLLHGANTTMNVFQKPSEDVTAGFVFGDLVYVLTFPIVLLQYLRNRSSSHD